jgi:hypothetical protein
LIGKHAWRSSFDPPGIHHMNVSPGFKVLDLQGGEREVKKAKVKR